MRRWQLSDDSGVTMPLIAIMLIALMGFVALVTDVGNGWMVRRSLIQATDSAALAAAQDFVNGLDGCASTAGNYVIQNQAAATMTQCVTPNATADEGRVSVTATHNVDTWFSGLLGLGDYTTTSTTIAAWGTPIEVTGLRPIGLCLDSHPDILNFINNPPATEQTYNTLFGSSQPTACGGVIPGNWGWVDFENDNSSNVEIMSWLLTGFPGEVSFSHHTVTSCTAEAHCYEGRPGSLNNSHAPTLNSLKTSGKYFTIPVFNYAELNGTNAKFHLMGVLRVRLIDFTTTGPQANRSFTFGILPGLITGTCCGGSGATGGSKVIAVCGVDPSAFAACP
jgi:hypothetical protein